MGYEPICKKVGRKWEEQNWLDYPNTPCAHALPMCLRELQFVGGKCIDKHTMSDQS